MGEGEGVIGADTFEDAEEAGPGEVGGWPGDPEMEDSRLGRGTGLLPLGPELGAPGAWWRSASVTGPGPGLGAAASRGFGSGSRNMNKL